MSQAQPLVWVNGRRAKAQGPHVSAFDRGYMRADGLFETLRSYGGFPACLERHMDRMRRGAAVIGIPIPDHLESTVRQAATESAVVGWGDAVVRFSVSRGRGDLTMIVQPDVEPTTVVSSTPLPNQAASYERGISLHVAAGTRNEQSVTAGLKTLGYAEAVIAFNAARAAGFDEALFLDTEGHMSEATTANLFVASGGVLRTPPLACGILPGITRALTIAIAEREAIPVHADDPLTLAELESAEEAFITSSVRELMPVTRVGPHAIGSGKPGPMWRRLQELYAVAVRRCA